MRVPTSNRNVSSDTQQNYRNAVITKRINDQSAIASASQLNTVLYHTTLKDTFLKRKKSEKVFAFES